MHDNPLKISRKSIHSKLIAINISVILLALIPICVALFLFEYNAIRNSLIKEVNIQADIISDNVAPAIVFNDKQAAIETLTTLKASPDIEQATLRNLDQSIFAIYHRDEKSQNPKNASSHKKKDRRHFYTYTKTVFLKQEKVAVLELKASLRSFYKRISIFGVVILSSATLSFLLSLWIAGRLKNTITQPLSNLMDSVHQVVDKQDLSVRPHIETNDEIGDLADAYNQLLSALQERDKRMHNMAYYDSLTELPNRRAFQEKIEQTIQISQKFNSTFALLFIDLDDFKIINDTHGHDIGDELLKVISQRLDKALRNNDFVFRLGGDEFAVLTLAIENENDAAHLAKKIIDIVSEPISISNNHLDIGSSIGISLYPAHANNANDLIKFADTAMYVAKRKSKNTYSVYSNTT